MGCHIIDYKVIGKSKVILSRGTNQSSINEEDDAFGNITGVVTDAQGEPLIGTSISVLGTSTDTITDLDGSFNLNDPDDATTFLFSFTGFTDQEVAIEGQTVFNMVLQQGVALAGVTILGSRGKPRSNADKFRSM